MVITGIVVAVSATALALNLMLKVVDATGRAAVDERGEGSGQSTSDRG
jgi:multisubunit Na+/H+ antiporter MnhC subunit